MKEGVEDVEASSPSEAKDGGNEKTHSGCEGDPLCPARPAGKPGARGEGTIPALPGSTLDRDLTPCVSKMHLLSP